jgi:adenine phosphoribosyltransferase
VPVDLKALVREVPDFPTPGIGFKDIMPLLADAEALHEVVARMTEWGRERSPHVVVGGEARGFLLGSALAYELGCGFVPARRPGKLPPKTISAEYSLEYGTNVLELQRSAIEEGTRVLVHDDVLATGGTAAAMAGLVEQLGGEIVGFAFLIELSFLGGREQLGGRDLLSLITY